MKVLITGSCGFIGYHLAIFLLKKKLSVFGIDSLNNYYDVSLKKDRLKRLLKYPKFKFFKLDISDKIKINHFFDKNKIDLIVNLAAYAGVQYSLKHPDLYFKTNEIGFYNILENAKIKKIKKIIFASSSSVFGNNDLKFAKENDNTDRPISLYAATKKNNEVLAHFYAEHFKIKIIGLRFFTAYGPLGRPDLSIFKFANSIINNKKIILNNNGNHYRDFTYIDDVIICIYKLIKLKKFNKIDCKNSKYFQVFNLGGGKKIKITRIVKILFNLFKKKTIIKYGPRKKGDIISSSSSTLKLERNINYKPKISIEAGLRLFSKWFLFYMNKN